MLQLSADHPIRCRCGRLHGTLSRGAHVARIGCYCLDCQSYAHALGRPDEVLDPLGGTDVIASLQQHLRFDGASATLACLSLRDGGILRWHAGCCATPIANTLRDPRLSYVAIVHTCLAPSRAALDPVFGPQRMAVNTGHARRKVPTGGLRTAATVAEGIARVARAGIDGSWRIGPFFDPDHHRPIVERRVLNAGELERARAAAQGR